MMKRRHLLVAGLAGLIAVVALAVPALAVAAIPSAGRFSGHDDAGASIRFNVFYWSAYPAPTLDGTTYKPVKDDEFKPQSKFEVAHVGGPGLRDSFGTCAYEPVNEVFSREYCLYGEFDAPDHVSGKLQVSISADGRRWPKPLASFRWSAELVPH